MIKMRQDSINQIILVLSESQNQSLLLSSINQNKRVEVDITCNLIN